MPDFLSLMAARSAERLAAARRREPLPALRRRAAETAAPSRLELHPRRFDLIAEIKRMAPSAGTLASDRSGALVAKQARAYARGGAVAISVLTEPQAFGGSLDDIGDAARAAPLPVMRKDFLIDPYQLFESRAVGAAGILLIVRLLSDAQLDEMLAAAAEAEMFALLEAFDEHDLRRATRVVTGAPSPEILLGINSRDLSNLQVDDKRFERLAAQLPGKAPRVAESGVTSSEDARRVAALGFDLALVGTALMRAANPAQLTAELIAAGAEEAARRCACS